METTETRTEPAATPQPAAELEQEPTGLWHQGFYELLKQFLSHRFDIAIEYVLSMRPRRVDVVLLRRKDAADSGEARMLRGLWKLLAPISLLEFKSPSRGFRRGDLARLLSYGLEYYAEHWKEVDSGGPMTLALVMPRANQAFMDELAALGLSLEPLGNGYGCIQGIHLYTTYVAITNEVSESEDDDFLRIFSEHDIKSLEAKQWMEQFYLEKQAMPDIKDREAEIHAEIAAKLVRALPLTEILRHIKPEERLKDLSPEERLKDLSPGEALLALPVEVLRGLSESYIASQPEHIQRIIRERLAAAS